MSLNIGSLLPIKIATGSTFSANVTGNTEDIGAFSTDEPIATDNGGNTYDVTLGLQEAEAIRIMDTVVLGYEAMSEAERAQFFPNGKPVHIRDFVENLSISAIWYRRRDVPQKMTIETYTNCTGVEDGDNVERRATETIKTWRFRARGKDRLSKDLM